MPCLETDFLVDLIRKKSDALKKLNQIADEELTVTPITVAELFKGAFLSRQKEKVIEVEEICMSLNVLNFDFLAAKKSGELLAELESKGAKIGDFDTMTAALALRHGQKLITKNKKHFEKIAELKTEQW